MPTDGTIWTVGVADVVVVVVVELLAVVLVVNEDETDVLETLVAVVEEDVLEL